jgi:hypothetical protein
MSDRYDNLLSVSSGLQTQGGVLKVIGLIPVIAAFVGAYLMRDSPGFAAVAFVVGLALGVGLYALGTLVAAMGEGLMALADIAVNTKVR